MDFTSQHWKQLRGGDGGNGREELNKNTTFIFYFNVILRCRGENPGYMFYHGTMTLVPPKAIIYSTNYKGTSFSVGL